MRFFIITVVFIMLIFAYGKAEQIDINADINNLQQIEDKELLQLMLKSFLYANDLENAYKVAVYGYKLFPEDIYWLEQVARISLWTGRYKEAIKYFKKLYDLNPDRKIEDQILSLAMQIYDYDTSIQIMERRLKEGNLEYLEDYIYAIKVTGMYTRGYNTLRYIIKNFAVENETILRGLSEFSFALNKKETGIRYLNKLIEKDGATFYDFLELADAYLYKKAFYKALEVLDKGIKRFKEEEELYYLASDISWGLGDRKRAFWYSKKLIDMGKERLVDYIRVVDYLYIEKKDLDTAASFIKKALSKYKNLYLARTYLYIQINKRNWRELVSFMEDVDTYIQQKLLQNSYITYVYAYALERTGNYEKAIDIYEKSINLSFSVDKLKSLLTLLIDLQKTDKLKKLLTKYRTLAKDRYDLWYIYSLGYLTLQDTEKSRYYLAKILKRDSDVSVLLLYSDLLEISGETERAKDIKYRIWKKIKDTQPKTRTQIENYLRTAVYFVSPKKFKNLLKKYKDKLDPETYWSITYSFLFSIDAYEKVYYLARKYNYLKNWMKMTLALNNDDRILQLYLIQKYPETIPIRDRVEAAVRTGQIGLAKRLAFIGLQENPADYYLYKWLRDLYMQYSGKALLRAEYSYRLTVNQGVADFLYKYPVTNRTYISFQGKVISQKSADTDRYINIPSNDSRVSFEIKSLFDRGEAGISFGIRTALDDFAYGYGFLSIYLKDRLTLYTRIYINDYADDSVYLMIGGIKSGLLFDLEYMISNRTFLNFTASVNRFYGQDKSFIGSGYSLESQVHYKLRIAYPDFSFRGYITTGFYSEKTGNRGIIETLSPDPEPVILPEDFVEFGGEFYFGYDNRYLYTRTLRPFFKVGISYNSITYLGYSGEVGIGGVLTKSDNIDFGISFFRGFTGVLDQYINIYVEYRKWF